MVSELEAVEKALDILKRELTVDEYVEFLRAMTPKFRNSVKELRNKTENLRIEEIFRELKNSKYA
jgi:hypothetical protein